MMAEIAALGSHDAETQVGSVLVNLQTNTVISTGFNGFVSGAPDDDLPDTRPDKYEYIQHSEQNLITHCALLGISTRNCMVVCTHSPCKNCMRLLWQAGIKTVIAKNLYKDFEEITNMKDLSVSSEITEEGYYKLIYRK